MQNPRKSKFRRSLIGLLIVVFVFTNIFGVLFFNVNQARAQYVDPFQSVLQSIWQAFSYSDTLMQRIWDEIKAVFFKNILGGLANMMAQEAAIWAASGGKGEAPMFITDFEGFTKKMGDAVIGDFVQDVMQNLTGIDVCNFDPRLAIDITLEMPMFPSPGSYKYQPDCTWTELTDHWEEIGQSELISFNIDIVEGGVFSENIDKLKSVFQYDRNLTNWDIVLQQYNILNDVCFVQPGGVRVQCNANFTSSGFYTLAADLSSRTKDLSLDIDKMLAWGGTEQSVRLSDGAYYVIKPESINKIKTSWNNRINPAIQELISMKTDYSRCAKKAPLEMIKDNGCKNAIRDFGLSVPSDQQLNNNADLYFSFEKEMKAKMQYAANSADAVLSGYEYLKNKINEKFKPDFFEGSSAFNAEIARSLLEPGANQMLFYYNMQEEIRKKGFEEYLNRRLEATINEGWESATDTVSDAIRWPSNAIRDSFLRDSAGNRSVAGEYTANIVADALGIFLQELWNEMARKLIESMGAQELGQASGLALAKAAREEVDAKNSADSGGVPDLTVSPVDNKGSDPLPVVDPANPYEEEVITHEGVESYVQKLVEQYSINFGYKDIDLFSEFQLNIKGKINPNIYNNVIDQNFALAINNKMTIKEAIEQGKLQGDWKFSWGEDRIPGSYHLENIKKLRKARVVPLGLELAIELVRDCEYRKSLTADGLDQFEDLSQSYNFGYEVGSAEPYKQARLRNCVFKPYLEGEAAADPNYLNNLRQYNIDRMNEVISASLNDVVNGFDQTGNAVCGDFDQDESPFCNLVDPNWVLKIPATQCALETDLEPYGEILMTNDTGQRYSRCPDFASCLQEDGKGGCEGEEYGFCVKEKNVWQFGASSCPEQYNSCRTYTLGQGGTTLVSYLKNTLSGDNICGPDNAGCNWYATKSPASNYWVDFASITEQSECTRLGGVWSEGYCRSERIYLNQFTQSCAKDNEGCNQFSLARSSNINLVTDSSFEYTNAGYFPENWELRLKEVVEDQVECNLLKGNYYETCKNYGYETEVLCTSNYGDWQDYCWDGSAVVTDLTNEADCTAVAGNTWNSRCVGAYNNEVIAANCLNDDQTQTAEYLNYCLHDILQYNLCENPNFTQAWSCREFNGTWDGTSCSGELIPADIYAQCNPLVDSNITQDIACSQCVLNQGSWQKRCEKEGQVLAELTTRDDCERHENEGSWVEYCQDAKLYGTIDSYSGSKNNCSNLNGIWRGYGPFSPIAAVNNTPEAAYSGTSSLGIELGWLSANDELQLIYRNNFNDNTRVITRGGDVYTAASYLRANQNLTQAVKYSLIKTYLGGQIEANTSDFAVSNVYNSVNSTVLTATPGTELQLMISFSGGECPSADFTEICRQDNALTKKDCLGAGFDWDRSCIQEISAELDATRLSINSIDQLRTANYTSAYQDYVLNDKVYYKKPPSRLKCHGYTAGDPPPRLPFNDKAICEANNGFWDQPSSSGDSYYLPGTTACYSYAPEDSACNNFAKVCNPEEVDCQLYKPLNNDPAIPGVVGIMDYCPSECVGYDSYKQQGILYEPFPDPLFHYFIPASAQSCAANEVGCSQFTNLDEVARGGEGIEYYTYIRQCIKPNLNLGEKSYFSWQGSASGPPQVVRYQLQSENGLAPATIDASAECGQCDDLNYLTRIECAQAGQEWTTGNDLNCLKLYDNDGRLFFTDITKTISVSDDCHPYRKTESTENNCLATNGQWQDEACIYNAIPSEGISCSAEANNCRAYVGDQGNNIRNQLFDNFESLGSLDWYKDTAYSDTGSLTLVGESVAVGGHSLLIPENETTIYKPVDLNRGYLYTLSFWAKSEVDKEQITIKFSTDTNDDAPFASLAPAASAGPVILSTEWQKYTVGPVNISWLDIEDNSLVFDSLNSRIYLDNVLLKAIRDNVYVIKNSWTTPESCDRNVYGIYEKGAMLGCQAYEDLLGQRHNLKSFSNLCRESTVGCQLLIDTKNSISPISQSFNLDNKTFLDDYIVEADDFITLVLDDEYSCLRGQKGCQRLGAPQYEGSSEEANIGFADVYLINDPDKYINVPNSILCSHDALGCSELVNETGGIEYYKIEPTKLCEYKQGTVNGNNVSGWFKKGSAENGCGSMSAVTNDLGLTELIKDQEACNQYNGSWSDQYNQCALILKDIDTQSSCESIAGEWKSGVCLGWPFNIYKNIEAAKYQGYVGECSGQYNGCTEFSDINPNYIFNGNFESFDQTGSLSNWYSKAATTGKQKSETDHVYSGNKAIRLTKTTSQECPTTYLYDPCQAPPYAISQIASRVERNKLYEISFHYIVPDDANGLGDTCPVPEAAFSIGPLDSIDDPTIYTYPSENRWKKVEFVYKAPYEDSVGTVYDRIYDLELVLYAPLNDNQAAEIGNCPQSYIIYDQVQIKEATEESYYVMDTGNSVDRSSCSAVDWDLGCVQFVNGVENKNEILKVQRDRECEEFLTCTQRNDDGLCVSAKVCTGFWPDGTCQEGYQEDNVRYGADNNAGLIIKRISNYTDQEGYIYRFGAGELSRLNRWRAGDFSGYTIPNRYPIEMELDDDFSFKSAYLHLNDNDADASPKDARYTEPICKIFPEETAPLPYELSTKQDYQNIRSIYSPDTSLASKAEIGNACSYTDIPSTGYSTYIPAQVGSPGSICTAPEAQRGKVCNDGAGDPCTAEECNPVEEEKLFLGQEGMCLEFDQSSPINDGIYDDQQYACLTYFPYTIDICAYKYGSDDTKCNLDPQCQWDVANNKCIFNKYE